MGHAGTQVSAQAASVLDMSVTPTSNTDERTSLDARFMALALTLGVILAVSSGAPTSHVTQQQSGSTSHP